MGLFKFLKKIIALSITIGFILIGFPFLVTGIGSIFLIITCLIALIFLFVVWIIIIASLFGVVGEVVQEKIKEYQDER